MTYDALWCPTAIIFNMDFISEEVSYQELIVVTTTSINVLYLELNTPSVLLTQATHWGS